MIIKAFEHLLTRDTYTDASLQCFDTVGWATGRASGLYKKLGVGLLVLMI